MYSCVCQLFSILTRGFTSRSRQKHRLPEGEWCPNKKIPHLKQSFKERVFYVEIQLFLTNRKINVTGFSLLKLLLTRYAPYFPLNFSFYIIVNITWGGWQKPLLGTIYIAYNNRCKVSGSAKIALSYLLFVSQTQQFRPGLHFPKPLNEPVTKNKIYHLIIYYSL